MKTLRINNCDFVLGLSLVLALTPVWAFVWLPTQDGPSHVYNARILADFATRRVRSPASEVFAPRLEPVPNWAGHAILASLMAAGAPADVAEKLFVSLYLVGTSLACRCLLRSIASGQEVWSPLAPLLAYNFAFFMGFYNFLIGIPIALLLFALIWRWNDRITPGRAATAAVMLIAIYLSHLVDLGVALIVFPIIVLVRSPSRFRTAWLVALIPAFGLACWYMAAAGPGELERRSLLQILLESEDSPERLLGRMWVSVFTPTPQHNAQIAKAALGGLAAVVLGVAMRRVHRGKGAARREFRQAKGPFLVATIELFAVALVLPQSWGRHGSCFTERLAIYIAFLTLTWLPAPGGSRSRVWALILSGVVAAAGYVPVFAHYRQANGELAGALDRLSVAPEGWRVFSLVTRPRPLDEAAPLEHAVERLCLNPGVVVWSNYEAQGFCFPLMYRPGVRPPDLEGFNRGDGAFVDEDLDRSDLVFVGPGCPSAIRAKVAERFRKLVSSDLIDAYSRP